MHSWYTTYQVNKHANKVTIHDTIFMKEHFYIFCKQIHKKYRLKLSDNKNKNRKLTQG